MATKSTNSTLSNTPIPVLVQRKLDNLALRAVVARKARRLTQQDLAHLADVGLSTVASIEKGHAGVAMGNLVKVLSALDLLHQLDALFDPMHDKGLVAYGVEQLQPPPLERHWRVKPRNGDEQ